MPCPSSQLLRGTQAMQRENSSSFARSMGGARRLFTGGCWSAEEAAYLRLHLAMLGQERLAAEAHVEMAEVEVLRQIAGYICAQFVRTEANLLSALAKASPGLSWPGQPRQLLKTFINK